MNLGDSTDALDTRGKRIDALLASDLAREVAGEFDFAREAGGSVPDASAAVIGRFHSLLSAADEGPVVILALAALQLREGFVQPVIGEAALDLLDSGEAMRAFAVESVDRRGLRGSLLHLFEDDLRTFVRPGDPR